MIDDSIMDKEHINRVEAWNEFKRTFPATCQKIDKLKRQIDLGNIYHSSDYDDKKKSQLVLAFIGKKINVYKKDTGELQVETQWGCRLFYELNYNGSVSSRIKDYDGNTYKLKTYPSASKIKERDIKTHVGKFFLVELNSNKTSQPTFLDKLKFSCYNLIQQKSWFEILKVTLAQLPIIKQLIKAIGNEK